MKKTSDNKQCISCGKKPLIKNETAICLKLLGKETTNYYCLECLAEYLDVLPQDILDKIQEFKEEGCQMFE